MTTSTYTATVLGLTLTQLVLAAQRGCPAPDESLDDLIATQFGSDRDDHVSAMVIHPAGSIAVGGDTLGTLPGQGLGGQLQGKEATELETAL